MLITLMGAFFILKWQFKKIKFKKKTLIVNSIMGILTSSGLLLEYLMDAQRLVWHIIFIGFTWIILIYFPFGIRSRIGNIAFYYWERGEMKKYSTLEKNIKKLRKKKWFSTYFDNGIYSTATEKVIYSDPIRTKLEQEGIVNLLSVNEELRDDIIERIKNEHMKEMVESYGLEYAEKLVSKRQ